MLDTDSYKTLTAAAYLYSGQDDVLKFINNAGHILCGSSVAFSIKSASSHLIEAESGKNTIKLIPDASSGSSFMGKCNILYVTSMNTSSINKVIQHINSYVTLSVIEEAHE